MVSFLLVDQLLAAAPPNIIQYQGRILNTAGSPITDTTASISFQLYSALTGGTCLWSNSSSTCATTTAETVTLTEGLISRELGNTDVSVGHAAILNSVFADNTTVYLQVVINTESLSPRKRLLSAPYAISSQTLDGFDSDQDGATSAAIPTLTSTGNLVITGNPSGSGVSAGTLYINPAAVDTAANDTIFGVADGGSALFRIDKEGDGTLTGDLTINGTALTTGNLLTLSGSTTLTTGNVLSITAQAAANNGGTSDGIDLIFNTPLNTTGTNINQAISITPTIGAASAGTNTINVLNIAATTVAPFTGGTNAVRFINIGNITGDTSSTTTGLNIGTLTGTAAAENAITIGTGWDAGITSLGGPLILDSGSGGIIFGTSDDLTTTGNVDFTFITGGAGGENLFITDTHALDFAKSTVVIDGTNTAATDVEETNLLEINNRDDSGSTGTWDTLISIESHDTNEIVADGLRVNAFFNTGITDALDVKDPEIDNALSIGDNIILGDAAVINFTNFDLSGVGVMTLNNTGTGTGLTVTQNTVADTTGTAITTQAFVIDVNEAANNDDVMVIRASVSTTPDITFRIDNNGTVTADDAFTGGGADFAEYFYKSDPRLTVGMLTCADLNRMGAVKRCSPDGGRIVGVISDNPGFIGNHFTGAEGDLSQDKNYAVVGLLGQIDMWVNSSGGPISAGDPLKISSTVSGYGALATGPSEIVGFAQEALFSGSGKIKVLVRPGWTAGDILTSDGELTNITSSLLIGTLQASVAGVNENSPSLSLRGWRWANNLAQESIVNLTTTVASATEFGFEISTTDHGRLAYFSNSGKVFVTGDLVFQDSLSGTDNYFGFDSAFGGALSSSAGFGADQFDYAVTFSSTDLLTAGEVVMLSGTDQVKRASPNLGGEANLSPNSSTMIGVVTANPGFSAGRNSIADQSNQLSGLVGNEYAIAVAGKAVTRVVTEGGNISPGDPITTATTAGAAKKATTAGAILGYALESFSGTDGFIKVFISPGYYSGTGTVASASNTLSLLAFGADGSLDLLGGSIKSVGSITGANNLWSIDNLGNLITNGTITKIISNPGGESVNTTPLLALDEQILLTGSVAISGSVTLINFADVDPDYLKLQPYLSDYQVFLTNISGGVVTVQNKTALGFEILNPTGLNASLSWLVLVSTATPAPLNQLISDNVSVGEFIGNDAPVGDLEPVPVSDLGALLDENPSSEIVDLIDPIDPIDLIDLIDPIIPIEAIAPIVPIDPVAPVAELSIPDLTPAPLFAPIPVPAPAPVVE